ncbi:hypothetical protein CONPUDRAFT_158363 [Coniophora puteana RWD-64-598 SS2]|uniref:Uncharacterized protein n=1 Tax=Coniophora puteana (strain RWD-64-598) TaxID=741705 RepID=A0A5M3MCH2_CONPW|nr:uncharacterized protein CONPUDRAFT_158363 [Coniophora puteana RWD-64-598 SS2]EIW76341.1 hypothetical protein CONPUDRAFT_158363 [Coniophora puteana RWD-64-598 SS2]
MFLSRYPYQGPSSGAPARTPRAAGSGASRPPSSAGSRPPSSAGTRPPSSAGTRPPSSTGNRPPSSAGNRPPSSAGTRPPSRTNSLSRSLSQSAGAAQGSAGRSLPVAFAQSNTTPYPSSQPRRVRDDVDLPASITAGLRRNRDDMENDPDWNPLELTGQDIKRYKVMADNIAESTDVDKNVLYEFIELGNIVPMLIDIRAHQEMGSVSEQDKAKRMWEKKLQSKDFKSMVTVRLTAALLSPDLTAFRVRFTAQVMAFVGRHPDIFGVDSVVLNDHQLEKLLYKQISSTSGSVRGTIKDRVTDSIMREGSLLELSNQLAASAQRMPMNSSHWRRIAALRFFTRQFYLGVGHFNKPRSPHLTQLYTRNIAPFLHPDLYALIQRQLGIDVRADVADAGGDGTLSGLGQGLEDNDRLPVTADDLPDEYDPEPEAQALPESVFETAPEFPAEIEPEAQREPESQTEAESQIEQEAQAQHDAFLDDFESQQPVDNDDTTSDWGHHEHAPAAATPSVAPSGFFEFTTGDGRVIRPRWVMREYWDYIDHSFNHLRKLALTNVHKNPTPGLTIERARDAELKRIMGLLMQADMADFRGTSDDISIRDIAAASDVMEVGMSIAVPQWMSIVQQDLRWD